MPTVAWDTTDAHAAPVGAWDSTDQHAPDSPSPIMDQFAGIGRSLGNLAKGTFDTLSSLVDPHMGQKIGDAVIDAQVDQWHKAKQEYSQGNYGNALRRGLAAATPFLGPMIENTAEKATSGKPGAIAEAGTDIVAPILLMKAAESSPEIAAAVKEHVGNFVDVVKGATSAVADTALSPGTRDVLGVFSPRLKNVLGIAARAREALAAGREIEANVPPPDLLKRVNLTPEEFKALPEKMQADVKALTDSMAQPSARRVPPPANPPPPGPIPLGEPQPPGLTMQQRIDAEIAARRPQPPPVVERTPIWQRPGIQPAQIPAGPVDPTVAPQPRAIVPQMAPVVEMPAPQTPVVEVPPVSEPSAGVHPPPEAFEGTYRAKRAQILADRMYESGITYGEAANLTPEHLTPTQWETLLGKDPETGVQYRTPSQKTIDQARVRLAHKYAAGRNAAAADAAKALADEMNQGAIQ